MRSTVLIICWSPVTDRSFKLMFTMIMPKLQTPVIGPLAQRALRAMWVRRNWFASVQDTAVMMNRKERENPDVVDGSRRRRIAVAVNSRRRFARST